MLLSGFFSSEGMDLFPDLYLFRLPHLLYIAACVAAFAILMKLVGGRGPRVRAVVVTVACVLMLFLKYAGEVIFIVEWYRFDDPVSSFSHAFLDWRTLISFQICGINNILLPLVIWFKWKGLREFVFGSSILGGLAVILYPVGILYGDPLAITFPIVRSLVVHFLLFFLPCYLVREGEFRFDPKRWWSLAAGTAAAMLWATYGNLVVDPGANYMYITANPFRDGPVPLLNVLPDGAHIPVLLAMIALAFAVMYLVFGRLERRKRRANAAIR